MLTLSEKLLLLGLQDDCGKVVMSASLALPFGLGGALLVELHLAERIDMVDAKVVVVSTQPLPSDILNEVLQLVSADPKTRDIRYWLRVIPSKMPQISQRLAQQLVAKGVLREQQQRLMWLFNTRRYPTLNHQPERDVRTHIREVVLAGASANEADLALLSLIDACQLLNEVFAKTERKRAKQVMADLLQTEGIATAISHVVQQISVALMLVIST